MKTRLRKKHSKQYDFMVEKSSRISAPIYGQGWKNGLILVHVVAGQDIDSNSPQTWGNQELYRAFYQDLLYSITRPRSHDIWAVAVTKQFTKLLWYPFGRFRHLRDAKLAIIGSLQEIKKEMTIREVMDI